MGNSRVEKINQGTLPIHNMEYWLGFDTKPLVKAGLMEATTDCTGLISEDIPVHLICIPTEKHDVPYDGNLINVIDKLTALKKQTRRPARLLLLSQQLHPVRSTVK